MTFRTRSCWYALSLLPLLLGTPSTLSAQRVPGSELSIERYELANGLEVVLLPDSTRDEVAIELWNHVGTRHEPAGKYGLAHFFEHVMPYGPESRSRAFLSLVDSLRTGSNARTRLDYTRYYKRTVRAGASLFLLQAAGRLGSSPGSDLTPERVENQRARVLAEMGRFVDARWGEPIGVHLARGTFGAAHPYGHHAYGTPEETNAVTRDDLVRWQHAHIRPEYTTLLVAGGFEPQPIRGFIESVFGRIPGGTRPPREAPRVPASSGGRDTLRVASDESFLFLAWPTPEWANEDAALLELYGQILAERLAAQPPARVTGVSVEASARELAGSFTIVLTYEPGSDVSAIEKWAHGTHSKTLKDLSEVELASAAASVRERVAGFLDELGWIGGRIELIGESLVFADDPTFYAKRLAQQRAATASSVLDVAQRWLGGPAFVLRVRGTGAQ